MRRREKVQSGCGVRGQQLTVDFRVQTLFVLTCPVPAAGFAADSGVGPLVTRSRTTGDPVPREQ
jgi:hypothetical protein